MRIPMGAGLSAQQEKVALLFGFIAMEIVIGAMAVNYGSGGRPHRRGFDSSESIAEAEFNGVHPYPCRRS
ncbi:hypothetical protein TRIP_B250020 [uncultured Desulfatiglans sp.]|nr:hypothetical protein TRIP_B250020 [uncultured Desulfatiglans sp.]